MESKPLKGVWETRASLPQRREGMAAGQIGNLIFVSHGYVFGLGETTDTLAYDINNDIWMFKKPASVRRSELAGVSHNGKLYAIGGKNLNVLEIYDADSDTWSFGAPMPTARGGLGAAVVGNTIYAIGGKTGFAPQSGTPLNVVEAYNIESDTWNTGLSPMPVPMMDIYSTVSHGGKIYVIGGYNGIDQNLVQIYDVASDTWSFGAPMLTPRSNLTASIKGNTIYAIGGLIGSTKVRIVEAYNIAKDSWSPAPSMPSPRGEHVSVSHGDQIFAIGGGYFGSAQDQNEVFRP